MSAMKDELEVPEWQGKLVECALDGASVNLGLLSGVAVRLKLVLALKLFLEVGTLFYLL